jgi:hypothetical protein
MRSAPPSQSTFAGKRTGDSRISSAEATSVRVLRMAARTKLHSKPG